MSKVTTEVRGQVLLIGLNRPEKRNAFDLEMYQELGGAYGQLEQDVNLRCGLLFAHGDHFTGGLDLPKWAASFSAGRFPEPPPGGLDPLGVDDAARVSKPLVMAVQGICLTLGIELLLGPTSASPRPTPASARSRSSAAFIRSAAPPCG